MCQGFVKLELVYVSNLKNCLSLVFDFSAMVRVNITGKTDIEVCQN